MSQFHVFKVFLFLLPLKFYTFEFSDIQRNMATVFYVQVFTGTEFVGGQSICLCLDIQVLQSANYVSGVVFSFHTERTTSLCYLQNLCDEFYHVM